MMKRWMMGWMALCLIATMAPLQAQSQSSGGSTGSDPDTLQAITLPAPIPLPVETINAYFPAFAGLTWTYGGNPREIAAMIRMLETQDTSDGPVYLWDGFQGQRWVQSRADGKVMEYKNNQWRTLFDLNAETGATWTIEPFGDGDLLDNAQMAIVSREEKLEVPYGGFAPVIHISVRNPNLADAGVTDLYFAQRIGLIKWAESSIAGPQSYDLVSFINRNEPPIVIDPPAPILDLADLFPTRSGLIWEYAGSPLKTTRRLSLSGVERSLPPRTFLWEGLVGAQRIRKTDDGKIMEIIGEGERLLFDLAAETGTSWTINAHEEAGNILDGTTVTVINRSEDVAVQYGKFSHVLHLGLKPSPNLADAGVTDMWFAPGIGLIKWSEITFAGPQTYELAELSGSSISPTPEPGDTLIVIDPIPFPLPEPQPLPSFDDFANRAQTERDGMRYEIATRKAEYTQGDVIEMAYRVTALDAESTFEFPSSQQYDFNFTRDDGEVAWTWSATISFAQVLTSWTLQTGESKTFFARVSTDFEFINQGSYHLHGWMPSTTPATENTRLSVPFQLANDPTRAGLSGTVKDAQGQLVNALVSLSQQQTHRVEVDGSVVISANSAVSVTLEQGGTFNFRSLEPGNYTLTARAEGYATHAQQIDIVAGLNTIDVILKKRESDRYTNIHDTIQGALITELATDKQQYAFGDSVYVRYRLTNIGADDLNLTFPSGQQYDLHLDGSNGRVWTWSQDKSFILAIRSQPLKSGDTYEFETAFVLQDNWNKNDPSFLLRAHLAVSTIEGGQVTAEQTEAIVKFAIAGWTPPLPGRPGPLSASVNITHEHYANNDTVNVTYRLTNTSADPITLAFNSGQRYDLVLHGPQGEVWGWSWTRLFTAEIGELVLASQDTFSFTEQIALSDIPKLTDGVYVLRTYMTSTDEMADATEAKLRFWVGETPAVALPPTDPALPTDGGTSSEQKRTADFDANGQIDFADFLAFAVAFGSRIGMANYQVDFDLDSDGQVAFTDFLSFAAAFGK